MNLPNPFKRLTKFELLLWLTSAAAVILSFALSGSQNLLTPIASLVGVTALIFVAKGAVSGQVLTVIFSVLYAIISLEYRYYGEMITYLGMTAPIAVLSVVSWLRHPYKQEKEVEVAHFSKKLVIVMIISVIAVTSLFYFILAAFDTPNLPISTVSITTSYLASYLMLFRSPYYAIAYAANDIILITLWILASIENISYFPMIICFAMFFINDVYGFVNWNRMKQRQAE